MAFTYDLQNDAADIYLTLLAMFKATKGCMTISASGDGNAIYDTIGSDIFTDGIFGSGIAGNICNPNSWVLWNSRGGDYQVLWNGSAQGHQMGVHVSPGSNYSLAGTSATVPPASPSDETTVTRNTGSNLVAGGGSPNNEPYTVNAVIGDVDEDYSFIVLNNIQGMRLSASPKLMSGMFIDHPLNPEGDPMDTRVVFACAESGCFQNNDAIFDSVSPYETAPSSGALKTCYLDGDALPPRNVGLMTPCRASNVYAMHVFEQPSDWTGKPWGFDGAIWWASPHLGGTGRSRIVGLSRLFRAVGSPCGNRDPFGDTWGFNVAQDRAYLGGVSIPWDSGVDLLI